MTLSSPITVLEEAQAEDMKHAKVVVNETQAAQTSSIKYPVM